ncbi:Trm112 family protein [Pasteurella skyensis]|uniref:Trm112 family protein n=1 Tax=Phocoenobacter skyensis TaxID=97481 RepID=A0AAJ6P196_9PAST|nr:Trm112 family protein [Pasteurella skyensis]MDP8161566.1 Trm112 family protein [Pasteurella skyensis]MDP8173400.1 Trm112 family protein [Pasteurella skyensis]MDP8175960.1 Trm112 family protein [Pasteurella skyensis]MDP8177928.1 Trm112 family protein [Pasteurella skyensis]MDP8182413.1 Trm112 family protein [Pasteurella skyensis]
MNEKLLNNLACPNCNVKLEWDKTNNRLICHEQNLAYPIENGIAVLLPESGYALEENQ